MKSNKPPKGFALGLPVDVVSSQSDLQKIWSRFEAEFPKQERNEPTQRGKKLIWYTTNGKTRRTRILRLFEKIATELGSLAGDVREVTAEGESTSTGKGKTYKIIRMYRDKRPNKIIKRGLTLAHALAHCRDPKTRGDDWFDGFDEDKKRR